MSAAAPPPERTWRPPLRMSQTGTAHLGQTERDNRPIEILCAEHWPSLLPTEGAVSPAAKDSLDNFCAEAGIRHAFRSPRSGHASARADRPAKAFALEISRRDIRELRDTPKHIDHRPQVGPPSRPANTARSLHGSRAHKEGPLFH